MSSCTVTSSNSLLEIVAILLKVADKGILFEEIANGSLRYIADSVRSYTDSGPVEVLEYNLENNSVKLRSEDEEIELAFLFSSEGEEIPLEEGDDQFQAKQELAI